MKNTIKEVKKRYKLRSLSYEKYHQGSKNTTHNWEKTFTNHTSDKRLLCRIYKKFLQLDNKEINNPIKK